MSVHEHYGERHGLVSPDERFAGWAFGDFAANRARDFLKAGTQPRTLWPEWDDVSAEGWPMQNFAAERDRVMAEQLAKIRIPLEGDVFAYFDTRPLLQQPEDGGRTHFAPDDIIWPPTGQPYGEGGIGIPDVPEEEA